MRVANDALVARLAMLLTQISNIDRALELTVGEEDAYHTRRSKLLDAAWCADRIGYETGYRIDLKEPDWPVFFIQLPTGQVSWHMPQFSQEWDGHSNEEKRARIERYCRGE